MFLVVQLIGELTIDWTTLRTLLTSDKSFSWEVETKASISGENLKERNESQVYSQLTSREFQRAQWQRFRSWGRMGDKTKSGYRECYGDWRAGIEGYLGSLGILWWLTGSGLRDVMCLALIVFKVDCDAKPVKVEG